MYLGNLLTDIKVYSYNPTFSLQGMLYTIYYNINLSKIYLKYIKIKTKTEFTSYYVISKVNQKL